MVHLRAPPVHPPKVGSFPGLIPDLFGDVSKGVEQTAVVSSNDPQTWDLGLKNQLNQHPLSLVNLKLFRFPFKSLGTPNSTNCNKNIQKTHTNPAYFLCCCVANITPYLIPCTIYESLPYCNPTLSVRRRTRPWAPAGSTCWTMMLSPLRRPKLDTVASEASSGLGLPWENPIQIPPEESYPQKQKLQNC